MRPLSEIFAGFECAGLLSGIDQADDAAVYRISDDRALIFTTDFFTPIVDDPYQYGAIAAANSMSDVFAMGGEVLLALNIAGFPEALPEEMMIEIIKGGAEKVREADGVIVGGHTVDSKEPFYGLAVCGTVHPDQTLEKTGACPGDLLVLTKPLGTGIITTAFKGDMADPAHISAAVESMLRLNRAAARAARNIGCRTATDVTGFSLIGHALEIARHSRVTLCFSFDKLPFLPGAKHYALQWLFPAGSNRNRKAYDQFVTFPDSVSEEIQYLLFTPETSGGLLLAIRPDAVEEFLLKCAEADQTAWIVGEVLTGDPGIVVND